MLSQAFIRPNTGESIQIGTVAHEGLLLFGLFGRRSSPITITPKCWEEIEGKGSGVEVGYST